MQQSDHSNLSEPSEHEDNNSDYSYEEDLTKEPEDLNESAFTLQTEADPLQDVPPNPNKRAIFHKPIELIYLIFSRFLPTLKDIAKSYGCRVDLTLNAYMVSPIKDDFKANNNILDDQPTKDQQDFEECKRVLQKEVDKISYIKLDDKKHWKFFRCVSINEKMQTEGYYFIKFNKHIYLYSNKFNEKELQEKRQSLINNHQIYTVIFNRHHRPNPMEVEVSKYIAMALQYYQSRFALNKIMAELDTSSRVVNIISQRTVPAFKMMKVKANVKYVVEGIACVSVKNFSLTEKERKTVHKYLQKVSEYPIYCYEMKNSIIVLISKDNILRQLLKKKEKFRQIFGVNNQTEFGMHIPACPSRDDKKARLLKCCQDASYDFWSTNGIHYFRKMVKSQFEDSDIDQIMDLVIRALAGFIDVKEQYEVMKKNETFEKAQKKNLEEDSDKLYQVKLDRQKCARLQKLLRRDVIEDEVYMKTKFNAFYSVFNGVQIGPYYLKRSCYDEGSIQLIEEEELKSFKTGEYLQAKFKVAEDELRQFEKDSDELQRALQEEMDSIKEKREGEKRKLVHMVEKLITVI